MSNIGYTCMGDLQFSGDGGKTWQTVERVKKLTISVRDHGPTEQTPVKPFDTKAEADAFHNDVEAFLKQCRQD